MEVDRPYKSKQAKGKVLLLRVWPPLPLQYDLGGGVCAFAELLFSTQEIPPKSRSCGGYMGSCFNLLVLAAFIGYLAVFAPRPVESLNIHERILAVSEAVGGVNVTEYLHKVKRANLFS